MRTIMEAEPVMGTVVGATGYGEKIVLRLRRDDGQIEEQELVGSPKVVAGGERYVKLACECGTSRWFPDLAHLPALGRRYQCDACGVLGNATAVAIEDLERHWED